MSRTVDPDDARAVLIRITPKGVETLRQVRVGSRRGRRPLSGAAGRRGSADAHRCRPRAARTARGRGRPQHHRTSKYKGVFARMWRQPKAVWAVAFASVVAFMGIGLVDPILKPIADNLNASPSQVSLLFTSYMAVMGVAMLITGVVSSRIGPKRTLLLGLVVIIAGAGLAGMSDTVTGNRWLAGALGPGQCAVHRDGAGHHRQLRARLGGAGDHPVRGGAGAGHRRRSAGRRRARVDLVARPVLRGVGADGCRARRHGVPAAVDTPRRARHHAGRSVPRAAAPRPARRRDHRAAVQLRLLHAAGVHAVPARHERTSDRADLLRLGSRAGLHVGGRRAAAAAPLRHGATRCW